MAMHIKICPICNKQIRNNNFERHVKVCKNQTSFHVDDAWKSGNEYKCPYCEKLFSKKGICTHIINKHTDEGIKRTKENYNNLKQNGEVWNKGLTKETDERVKQRGVKRHERCLKGELQGYWKGKKHTEEEKQRISVKMSILNKGGKCKWYEIDGVKVQGTWELNIAKKLTLYNIKWLKIKTNSHTMQYIDDNNKPHSYTPDFYLEDYNVYLEVKGFWWGNDKRKMEIVKSTYPTKKIIVIEKELYNSLRNSETKEEFLKLLEL